MNTRTLCLIAGWVSLSAILLASLTGSPLIERRRFPIRERNDFGTPPTALGLFAVVERRVEFGDDAVREPLGITVSNPTGADEFSNVPEITREEQQRIAIDETRAWLDAQFGIARME